jgi:hypothetical protein
MKTEIKDYLPLYLGCKFKHDSDVGTYELCGYNIYNDHVQNALGMDTYSSKGTRLILRKLSDMTEEEWKEWGRTYGTVFGACSKETWLQQFEQFEDRPAFGQGKKSDVENPVMERSKVVTGLKHEFYTYSPTGFRFLLSKSFDLFGLIEQGLAIDKATLKAS